MRNIGIFALVFVVTMSGLAVAGAYDKYAVSGWEIVGVWQQNYGIDVQNVVERSKNGEYRLRYVTSKDPKEVDDPSKLKKAGNKYTIVGSRFGDYFIVEGTQLKTHDKDGYIETLKPVANR